MEGAECPVRNHRWECGVNGSGSCCTGNSGAQHYVPLVSASSLNVFFVVQLGASCGEMGGTPNQLGGTSHFWTQLFFWMPDAASADLGGSSATGAPTRAQDVFLEGWHKRDKSELQIRAISRCQGFSSMIL